MKSLLLVFVLSFFFQVCAYCCCVCYWWLCFCELYLYCFDLAFNTLWEDLRWFNNKLDDMWMWITIILFCFFCGLLQNNNDDTAKNFSVTVGMRLIVFEQLNLFCMESIMMTEYVKCIFYLNCYWFISLETFMMMYVITLINLSLDDYGKKQRDNNDHMFLYDLHWIRIN